ncbi:MAG TPA: hypothetical protein VGB42_01600 [Candidatus Thermoplasmatota archaeon]
MNEWVAYTGDPDLQDGRVLSVNWRRESLEVEVEGGSGAQVLTLTFHQVAEVGTERPVGMQIAGLSEVRSPEGSRGFIFLNWDDGDGRALEVWASSFSVKRRPKS